MCRGVTSDTCTCIWLLLYVQVCDNRYLYTRPLLYMQGCDNGYLEGWPRDPGDSVRHLLSGKMTASSTPIGRNNNNKMKQKVRIWSFSKAKREAKKWISFALPKTMFSVVATWNKKVATIYSIDKNAKVSNNYRYSLGAKVLCLPHKLQNPPV